MVRAVPIKVIWHGAQCETSGWHSSLEVLNKLCGTSKIGLNQLPQASDADIYLSWMVFLNCFVWMAGCIMKHIHNRANNVEQSRLDNSLPNYMSRWAHFLSRGWEPSQIQISGAVFVTWGPCTAYVFYLYGTVIRKNIISTSWEFGQIIAVTSLVPFLVEFIYIQYSKFNHIPHTHRELVTNGTYSEGIEKGSRYKYPPGLQITRIDEKSKWCSITYKSTDLDASLW